MPGQNSEFLAYIKRYGVSKTSHFRLSAPVAFQGEAGKKFSNINKLLGLRCEATDLPGRQIISNESRTYGPTYKTPYQSLYQEITLNFLETADLTIRDFFETWLSGIYNPINNTLAYPKTYRYDCTLTQYDVTVLDEKDPASSLKAVATWSLFNSFPTAVNQMPVAWSEDGVHRVSVTFAYEYYVLFSGQTEATKKPTLNSPKVPAKGSAVS
jgi:hypothetical protein